MVLRGSHVTTAEGVGCGVVVGVGEVGSTKVRVRRQRLSTKPEVVENVRAFAVVEPGAGEAHEDTAEVVTRSNGMGMPG